MSGHQSVPYAYIDPIPLSVIPFAETNYWLVFLVASFFVAVRLLSELVTLLHYCHVANH